VHLFPTSLISNFSKFNVIKVKPLAYAVSWKCSDLLIFFQVVDVHCVSQSIVDHCQSSGK